MDLKERRHILRNRTQSTGHTINLLLLKVIRRIIQGSETVSRSCGQVVRVVARHGHDFPMET